MKYYKLTINYSEGLLVKTEHYLQSMEKLYKSSSRLEKELRKIQRENKRYFLESRIRDFRLREIAQRTYNKNNIQSR